MSDTPITANAIQQRLRALADSNAAAVSSRFFKTGPGEYGEGDVFLGIRVPVLRQLARELRSTPLDDLERLLRSGFHEERHLALIILVWQFEKGTPAIRQDIHARYLENTHFINNWDLVDCSAPSIVGGHLARGDRSTLDRLARSSSLWERRIGIVATQHLIRSGEFADTLRIAAILLQDGEDLIHKAVGWMLREVGERDRETLEGFLQTRHRAMPRTMLRYAIEKLPRELRGRYLAGGKPRGGMG